MLCKVSSSHADPFWVEMLSGGALICWGIYVACMDSPLSAVPAYDVLAAYVPNDAWVSIAMCIGLLQVGAALRQAPRIRWIAAWGGLVFWKVLGVSLFNSGDVAPAAVVYCSLAVGNIPTIIVLRPRLHPPRR